VALARSRRLDELMRGILAELRLVFHAMDNPRGFHEPYLERNREILSALKAADRTKAELLLAAYLDDAEQQLVERYSELLGP
jgi:DNA-binding GntR family transcriptional regulator